MPPVGGCHCGLHAGGSAADDQDLFLFRRRGHREFGLHSCRRVHHAGGRLILKHAIKTSLVAGNAVGDEVFFALQGLVGQVRIGQKSSCHGDQIGLTFLEDLFGQPGSLMRLLAITGTETALLMPWAR